LHDKVHKGVGRVLSLGVGAGHGRVEEVLDGDLVLDAPVQEPLSGGQWTVHQHLNLWAIVG